MKAPEFDDDGYPTDETLEVIKSWSIKSKSAIVDLLKFCASAWKWVDYTEVNEKDWTFHTGGWSGNEDIIAAMRGNNMFWLMTWYSSTRGGHYEFRV